MADRRDARALAVLVGGLAVANVARSTVVPRRWHFPYNLAMGAFAVAVARFGGLTADELGCSRRSLREGAKVGGLAFAGISTVLVVAAVAGALDDDRTDVDAGEMALRTLAVIPLGTVLVEELAFRGTLYALLERLTTPGRAMAIGAALFGLWHVAPAWSDGPPMAGGTFLATTAAGVGFIWLRRRSGSLLAPVLAHVGTNSTTFALSWAFRPGR